MDSARAINSLPLPTSVVISTASFVRATRTTLESRSCMTLLFTTAGIPRDVCVTAVDIASCKQRGRILDYRNLLPDKSMVLMVLSVTDYTKQSDLVLWFH